MARKSSILLDVESAARYSTCSRISACIAGWSSLVARRAHNPKVVGSNPAPATIRISNPLLAGFLLAISAAQVAVLADRWASHQHRLRAQESPLRTRIASTQENIPLRAKPKVQQTLQPKLKTLVMIVRIQHTLILRSSSRQLINQCICCLPH